MQLLHHASSTEYCIHRIVNTSVQETMLGPTHLLNGWVVDGELGASVELDLGDTIAADAAVLLNDAACGDLR